MTNKSYISGLAQTTDFIMMHFEIIWYEHDETLKQQSQ